MYRQLTFLLVMTAICLPGRAAFAQSGLVIDQLFVSSMDDGQIEQMNISTGDASISDDLSHFYNHTGSGFNPRSLLSQDFTSLSLFIPQVEQPELVEKSRSFVEEFQTVDDVDSDRSSKDELLKALADFGDKTGDEQVEAFRKIFEAVLEEENQSKAQPEPILELSGVVLDETRTKSGRDFYELFYSEFDIPQRGGTVTIRIEERVIPGSGSLILIEVNQNEAFTVQLRPGADHVEQAVQQAVKGASELLSQNNDNFTIY